MLARRTILQHPLGTPVDMPRLVPSFSSKGFPLLEEKGRKTRYSDVTSALELIGPYMNDSILISAYDLHHKCLRRPQRFYKGKELVFIDSGGYELSPDWDSTEPKQGPYKGSTFEKEDYRSVLSKLPQSIPFVVASFDWDTREKPIEDQILAAQELFNDFPQFLHNFVVRPGGKKRGGKKKYLDIDDVIRQVAKLRAFHIVGVTEKELGGNLLDRVVRLAKLRTAMDRENVSIPIQVWGGLDPVMSPLYFFAGAEIFDGVSWLRYVYHDGMAVYRDCYGILKHGIETSLAHVRIHALNDNVTMLQRLTTSLRKFVDSGGRDFSVFEWHQAAFERAYGVLCTKIPELRRDV